MNKVPFLAHLVFFKMILNIKSFVSQTPSELTLILKLFIVKYLQGICTSSCLSIVWPQTQ